MPVPMSGERASFLNVTGLARRTYVADVSGPHTPELIDSYDSIVPGDWQAARRLPGYGMRSLVSDERQRARSCYAVLWTVSCLRGVPHYRAWRLVALRSLGLHARGGIVICEVNKDSRGKDPIGAVRRRHLVTMTRQSSYATVERISPDPLLAIYFPRL